MYKGRELRGLVRGIRQSGHAIVSLADLLTEPTRDAVALTFDDGFASLARLAEPILTEYGAQRSFQGRAASSSSIENGLRRITPSLKASSSARVSPVATMKGMPLSFKSRATASLFWSPRNQRSTTAPSSSSAAIFARAPSTEV